MAQLTKDFLSLMELSDKYSVPLGEIVQIDFNRTGIHLLGNEIRPDFRVRFQGSILDGDDSWFALPVRVTQGTNYRAGDSIIYFGEQEIGQYKELMLDTCEQSYQRGPKLLNLNSRSRSNCGGCTVCVHNYKKLYDETVIKDQRALITARDIRDFFLDSNIDIASLKQIAIVTGLFGSEDNAIEHIELVNKIARDLGFMGELMYFGCEVNSPWAIRRLAEIDNFFLIYALDIFTKRNKLAGAKERITLADARNTLSYAKSLGLNTTIAYIAGIDSLVDMRTGFAELIETFTRFPIINIYQVQTPGQVRMFDPEAMGLEYYAKSRIIVETLFKGTGLIPKRWENYRPLWYEYYQGERLLPNAYGENE